jgi:leucyl aminopeptidase
MNIDWQIAPMADWEADALVFFAFETVDTPLPGLPRWLASAGEWMAESAGLNDFRGKWGEVAVFYGPAALRVTRVVYVGLGPRDGFDLDKWRGAVASGFRKCRELRLAQPALPVIAWEGLPWAPEQALHEALIGALLGLYRFDELKTKDRDELFNLDRILLLHDQAPAVALEEQVRAALAVAAGVRLARDLVTAPANRATPAFLVKHARQLADRYGFRLTVIDQEQAAELGMGAFLAVAQGSREPAYLIVLEYAPAGSETDAPLVFVGKGITFDTGGISIKPSERMELMKHDMAGAAAVLGAFAALGQLGSQTRVVGLIPCTENMPDGKAYKPGDVIRSLAGLTIEVISTDAEGRMVLCDALTYAQRYQPAAIVDLATLTGACIIALGDQVGSIMGNRDALVQKVQELAWQGGERLWPLPLWDFYFDDLKSDVADFRNVGSRKAGSIMGGMFLKQFVPEEIPWVHLDIAGPAWIDKDLPTVPKGASGFGVRLLVELARQWPQLRIQ